MRRRSWLGLIGVTVLVLSYQNCGGNFSMVGFPDIRGFNAESPASDNSGGGQLAFKTEAGANITLDANKILHIDQQGHVKLIELGTTNVSYLILNLTPDATLALSASLQQFASVSPQPEMVESSSCANVESASSLKISLKATDASPELNFYEDVACVRRRWNLSQDQDKYEALLASLLALVNPSFVSLIDAYRLGHPGTTPQNLFGASDEIIRYTAQGMIQPGLKLAILGDGRIQYHAPGDAGADQLLGTLDATFLRRVAFYVSAYSAKDLEQVEPPDAGAPADLPLYQLILRPGADPIVIYEKRPDRSVWQGGQAPALDDKRAELRTLLEKLLP